MWVRVIEYETLGRDSDGSGELIALITTITDPAAASAQELAQAYCQRWEEETGNDQLKTCLRGPGQVLRSKCLFLNLAGLWSWRGGWAGWKVSGAPGSDRGDETSPQYQEPWCQSAL